MNAHAIVEALAEAILDWHEGYLNGTVTLEPELGTHPPSPSSEQADAKDRELISGLRKGMMPDVLRYPVIANLQVSGQFEWAFWEPLPALWRLSPQDLHDVKQAVLHATFELHRDELVRRNGWPWLGLAGMTIKTLLREMHNPSILTSVREGMQVRSADGRRLGKMIHLHVQDTEA